MSRILIGRHSRLPRPLLLVLVAAGYYLSARLGLLFVSPLEKLAVFWPPAGFALLVFMVSERKLWPYVAATIFATNAIANYAGDNTLAASLGFAVANTAEPLLLSTVLALYLGHPTDLRRLPALSAFLVLVPGVVLLTSALGALVPVLAYGVPYWPALWGWFLSDSFGILLLVPFALSLVEEVGGRGLRGILEIPRPLEAALITGALLAVSYRTFHIPHNSSVLMQPYILFPFFLVLALRHSPLVATANLVLSGALAITGTMTGEGSFSDMSSLADRALTLQVFLGMLLVTTLIIKAAVLEREEAALGLRLALEDREALVREVHHRVKNNMAVIVSLLSIESLQSGDEGVRQVLKEMQGRVHSMALAHESLYRGADLRSTEAACYIASLVDNLRGALSGSREVAFAQRVEEPLGLSPDTLVPCGLIINELVTNSLKHAFEAPYNEGAAPPALEIEMREVGGGRVSLLVRDNGRGLPEGFDPAGSRGLGLRLVANLTRQLGGTLKAYNEGGAVFLIEFPKYLEHSGPAARA